jgi:hypothetical protein
MRRKVEPSNTPREFEVMYSQSLINSAIDRDVCPKYLKYKYLEKIEEKETEETKSVMFRGRYFEWHLLGATRDGQEPKFHKNQIPKKDKYGKKDFRPQAQIDMDVIVEYARDILMGMGLDTDEGEKQLHLVSDDLEGHLDWVTKDFANPERQAIYDVKFTETAHDDRFRGWADFESKIEAKIQAIHYIKLMFYVRAVYMPFYFLVFGKSFWVRVIKVEMTNEGVNWHEMALEKTR